MIARELFLLFASLFIKGHGILLHEAFHVVLLWHKLASIGLGNAEQDRSTRKAPGGAGGGGMPP